LFCAVQEKETLRAKAVLGKKLEELDAREQSIY
jgi:hypothetical protein